MQKSYSLKVSTNSKPLLVFYLLVAYVALQFFWWGYMLYDLNKEIYQHKVEIALLRSDEPTETIIKENELKLKLNLRVAMIIGEGSVFLVLMIFGIEKIRRTFKIEKELSERQKNFLLSITHELKSPIASNKLQLQTLQKRELDRPKQQEIIANAINDTNRLNNLVENILLVAKMENQKMYVYLERVNLSEYITTGINQMIESFNYSQKINLSIDKDVFLPIDRTLFPSIIINLFENAVKYSPPESTISICLVNSNSNIVLSVSDQGIGVPENERVNIFNKFYRVGNEETRKAKGTGLGLFIVRFIVKQHNGVVQIKNNKPQGSIFEIEFKNG